MARFVMLRLLRLAAVLVAITIVSFFFLKLIPGDPVAIRLGEHASPAEPSCRAEALFAYTAEIKS